MVSRFSRLRKPSQDDMILKEMLIQVDVDLAPFSLKVKALENKIMPGTNHCCLVWLSVDITFKDVLSTLKANDIQANCHINLIVCL